MRYIGRGFSVCIIIVFSGLTLADGDLANGEEIFKKCAACHSLNAGESKIGPTLHGVFGRESASVDGFPYSMAMKNLGIVWDEKLINEYLKNPTMFAPGARMLTGGIADDEQRHDLIQYLKEATK